MVGLRVGNSAALSWVDPRVVWKVGKWAALSVGQKVGSMVASSAARWVAWTAVKKAVSLV